MAGWQDTLKNWLLVGAATFSGGEKTQAQTTPVDPDATQPIYAELPKFDASTMLDTTRVADAKTLKLLDIISRTPMMSDMLRVYSRYNNAIIVVENHEGDAQMWVGNDGSDRYNAEHGTNLPPGHPVLVFDPNVAANTKVMGEGSLGFVELGALQVLVHELAHNHPINATELIRVIPAIEQTQSQIDALVKEGNMLSAELPADATQAQIAELGKVLNAQNVQIENLNKQQYQLETQKYCIEGQNEAVTNRLLKDIYNHVTEANGFSKEEVALIEAETRPARSSFDYRAIDGEGNMREGRPVTLEECIAAFPPNSPLVISLKNHVDAKYRGR
jgi:hypothetical protein